MSLVKTELIFISRIDGVLPRASVKPRLPRSKKRRPGRAAHRRRNQPRPTVDATTEPTATEPSTTGHIAAAVAAEPSPSPQPRWPGPPLSLAAAAEPAALAAAALATATLAAATLVAATIPPAA